MAVPGQPPRRRQTGPTGTRIAAGTSRTTAAAGSTGPTSMRSPAPLRSAAAHPPYTRSSRPPNSRVSNGESSASADNGSSRVTADAQPPRPAGAARPSRARTGTVTSDDGESRARGAAHDNEQDDEQTPSPPKATSTRAQTAQSNQQAGTSRTRQQVQQNDDIPVPSTSSMPPASTRNLRHDGTVRLDQIHPQLQRLAKGATPLPSSASTSNRPAGKTLPSMKKSLESKKPKKGTRRRSNSVLVSHKGFLPAYSTPGSSGAEDSSTGRYGDLFDTEGENDLDTVMEGDEEEEEQEDDEEHPRRSISVAGYDWKSQEVTLKASVVVGKLTYPRKRTFHLPVYHRRRLGGRGKGGKGKGKSKTGAGRGKGKGKGKGKIMAHLARHSSMSDDQDEDDDDDEDDDNDSNGSDHENDGFHYASDKTEDRVTFRRGDLAYFLPDPSWLDIGDVEDPVTIDDLDTKEWWLGLVLDCVDLRLASGDSFSALRIAWCYSPEQARNLFDDRDPRSKQWRKELDKYEFWDNEMLASDHIDFVGAECTGGKYRGGDDQNAEELEIHQKNAAAMANAQRLYEARLNTVKNPGPFRKPVLEPLPARGQEKVCIRTMIRGLEQSDVDRCLPPAKQRKNFPYASQRWLEDIGVESLDQTCRDWAELLSHAFRRLRTGWKSSTVKENTVRDDAFNKVPGSRSVGALRSLKKERAKRAAALQYAAANRGGRGKTGGVTAGARGGKGKAARPAAAGRGKGIPPPHSASSRMPHIAKKKVHPNSSKSSRKSTIH